MTTTTIVSKLLNFDDYIRQYPDDGQQYQLIEGKLIEMMRPLGKHEKLADLSPLN